MQVHVLLAEDEPLVALTVGELLTDAGYRVTVAHDGIEAVDAYAADPADILVTDVRMPRLDGLDLTARLRETNPNLPVVITTGHALSGMIVVPTSEAPTTVFTKPVPSLQLLEAIRKSLAATPLRDATPSSMDDGSQGHAHPFPRAGLSGAV